MASVTVPLLSEHKIEFVRNRALETILGGIRIFFGSSVPPFVYTLQIIVHQLPMLIGSLFTILAEVSSLSLPLAALSCGVLILLLSGIGHILNFLLHRNASPVQKLKESVNPTLESDVTVFESCFSLHTARTLFPRKKFFVNVFLHSLICGVLIGYGIIYLSPSRLYKLYGQAEVVYLIFLLSWITICVGVYSLTVYAPPETATFRLLDHWEIKPLMRPFYIALFFGIDLIFWLSLYATSTTLNKVMHVVFILLPLLWFSNILPPLDALFLWLIEQLQVWIAGGSPTFSFFRLFVQVFLWSMTVLALFFIPIDNITLPAAVTGYILSLDLVSLWNSFLMRVSPKFKSKTTLETEMPIARPQPMWNIFESVFFSIMLISVIGLCAGFRYNLSHDSTGLDSVIIPLFGYALLLLFLLAWFSSSFQVVYVFGDIFRNGLYPGNTRQISEFVEKQRKLRWLGKCRNIIILGSPLILNVYITLLHVKSLSVEQTRNSTAYHLTQCVAVLRAFRWSWQQTDSALLETTVVHFIVQYTTISRFINDEIILLLIASFVNDRLWCFLYKLHTVIVILVTSVTQKKYYRSYNFFLFGLNLVCFPIVLTCVAICALLSAPLLPVCTLPIFWMGFPRPTRFWPVQESGLDNICQDAIYYEEIMPQLVKELSHIIASGGLRVINPGDVFLLRFDDRLIWLSFIERGYGYYRVSAKGLELQQTSCHAVEASAIDAILEWTFETPEDSRKKCRLNKSPFHVYSPLNIAVIETYVETRNVLTGVIHSSDTLQAISDCFPKCLIWILARYMTSKNNSLKTDTTELKSNRHSKLEKNVDNPEQHMIKSNSITKVESNSPRSRPSTAEHYARLPKAPSVHCVNTSVLEPLDDPWLDEDDPLDLEFEKAKTKSPALLQSFIGFLNITDDTSVMSQLNSSQLPGRIDETTFETVLEKKGEDVMERIRGPKDKPLRSDSLRESYLAAGFPEAWMNSPVSQNVINLLTPHFPSEWFEFVLTKVVDHDRKQLTSITSANVVLSYRHLVLTSHSIINQIQNGGKKTTISPSLVYRTFIRDLPWSPATNWLMKTPLLLDLVIAAYRYSCKIALDQTLLGKIDSDSEFADYLQDYEENWHIGLDTDRCWQEAISKHVPNLFSLGYNPSAGTYTSHLLARRHVPIYIGKLNKEMVFAIWSSLNFELLYLTNDDEERYSIQAQSALLRNLTVQGADPPLGYPIYVSRPFLVKAVLSQTSTSTLRRRAQE